MIMRVTVVAVVSAGVGGRWVAFYKCFAALSVAV